MCEYEGYELDGYPVDYIAFCRCGRLAVEWVYEGGEDIAVCEEYPDCEEEWH